MLIDFTVGNFLSFKNKVAISMIASSISGHESTNIFKAGKMKLLKSAVVYGANASGKSNLIKAMSFMKNFINESGRTQSYDKINIEPFRLSTITEEEPSFFEIRFILNNDIYRYGFEVNKKEVVTEWLFYKKEKTREVKIFTRERQVLSEGQQFKAGKELFDKNLIRNNALVISVGDQFNEKFSKEVVNWIKFELQIISGLNDTGMMMFTTDQLKDNNKKNIIIKFLELFDLNFVDISLQKISIDDILPDDLLSKLKKVIDDSISEEKEFIEIKIFLDKFNEKNKKVSEVEFSLDSESEGTKKLFAQSAPLIDTFERGVTLVIDEFDARLHPLLSRRIIDLFHSTGLNKKNAQLIFATHDTNLLNKEYFRRDQIWFTEKDEYGATDLYSLVEINLGDENNKKVRKDASYAKDYILGKYGAIPFIGDFHNIPGFGDGS